MSIVWVEGPAAALTQRIWPDVSSVLNVSALPYYPSPAVLSLRMLLSDEAGRSEVDWAETGAGLSQMMASDGLATVLSISY